MWLLVRTSENIPPFYNPLQILLQKPDLLPIPQIGAEVLSTPLVALFLWVPQVVFQIPRVSQISLDSLAPSPLFYLQSQH